MQAMSTSDFWMTQGSDSHIKKFTAKMDIYAS